MPKPHVFSKKFVVEDDVIDHFSHVNNLAYIKWVLEISKDHWRSSVSSKIDSQFGWMILKHQLQYKGQAKLKDELLIKTWIEDFSIARSTRKTEIIDIQTHKIIFESKAQWCFVDLATQKPTRLKENILKPFFEEL